MVFTEAHRCQRSTASDAPQAPQGSARRRVPGPPAPRRARLLSAVCFSAGAGAIKAMSATELTTHTVEATPCVARPTLLGHWPAATARRTDRRAARIMPCARAEQGAGPPRGAHLAPDLAHAAAALAASKLRAARAGDEAPDANAAARPYVGLPLCGSSGSRACAPPQSTPNNFFYHLLSRY
jgi:hypothetical protein